MHKNLKHLIIALGAALLISSQAMAGCGGDCRMQQAAKQSSNKECQYKSGHGAWHGKKRHASASYPGRDSHYLRKMLRRGDEIGLSEEQRRQIEDIYIAARKEGAEARARAETVAAGFHGKLKAGKVDDAEVDAYAARMGELHAARLKANLAASRRAAALLSDEQKKRLYAGRPADPEKK